MTRDEVISRVWAEYGGRIVADVQPAESGWWVTWQDRESVTLVTDK